MSHSFDDTHDFTFGKQVGVSPILFYDPVERVVATLHPNHTYDKVAFDPWRQGSWDVNDTVALDPRTDADVKGFTAKYFESEPEDWETWFTATHRPAESTTRRTQSSTRAIRSGAGACP